MTRKTANLISELLGAASAAAIALISHFEVGNFAVINGAITLATSTAITIIESFVTIETKKKEVKKDE